MSVNSKKLNGLESSVGRPASLREQRKKEALELAKLLYDIYKKTKGGAKITRGQKNADRQKNL